jgi:Family of unknown function (DUF6042)
MADGPQPDFDVFYTGWMRLLPEPAFRALSSMLWLRANPVAGELDELAADGWLCLGEVGGLDAPFDPAGRLDRPDDDAQWTARWTRMQAFARDRGLPMATPRDTIYFLLDVGVLERVERGDAVLWRSVAPIPLAEDVVALTREEREREARLRWEHAFAAAEARVADWLADVRAGTPATPVRTTLVQLAGWLGLDVDDARFGLAHAAEQAGDVDCDPDPELAVASAPLTIVVARRARRDATASRP